MGNAVSRHGENLIEREPWQFFGNANKPLATFVLPHEQSYEQISSYLWRVQEVVS
jgi:hypothetical protein